MRLNFYTEAELEQIVNRGARVLGIGMTAGRRQRDRAPRPRHAAHRRAAAAARARLRAGRGRDIDRPRLADRALTELEVDAAGLDAMDRRYLTTIAENYGGGPVGIETMAAALSEPRDAIEEIIEPFLIQKGFMQRTPRGRLLTAHAFRHLGLAEPARDPAQFGLFGTKVCFLTCLIILTLKNPSEEPLVVKHNFHAFKERFFVVSYSGKHERISRCARDRTDTDVARIYERYKKRGKGIYR